MGICCSKDDYDPASNFENVVVAQMAKEAAEKLANQSPYATDPLLNNPDKLEFENVDFSNSSAEYDREELDALLKSDSEDPIQAQDDKSTEAKTN